MSLLDTDHFSLIETLLIHNTQYFSKVPGLLVEDWSLE